METTETTKAKKVVLTVKKGDTVNFKTGPAGKKVYTGVITKYPDNKNITIKKEDGEEVVVAKELIESKVAVA